ncbi:hypothetical protein SK128_027171 [Halocaridina rubra]|uniref:Methyltransferase FkbM domain-containing protein n=1 Tax=Halocaridina rubra TaxID=373956 RepID=A0AAN9AGP4_HALRR
MKFISKQTPLVSVFCCWTFIFFVCLVVFINSFLKSKWTIKDSCKRGSLKGPLEYDDPYVLNILQENFMTPPSTLPYNLSDPKVSGFKRFSWPFIHNYVKYFFQDQTHGFFMEAGALDGEFISNTLWLEYYKNWSGILLEPDANTFKHLTWKRRKSWIANTCISATNYPKETLFASQFNVVKGLPFPWLYRANTFEITSNTARGFDFSTWSRRIAYSGIQCFPLTSYLLALNVTTLDFLSLDTQGNEWGILKTVFDAGKIKVRAIVVEHYPTGEMNILDPEFVNYMKNSGYYYVDCDSEPNYFFILKEDKILLEKARIYERKGHKKYCNTTFME